MRVCCMYCSDLALRARRFVASNTSYEATNLCVRSVRSLKGMVEVLQFKATVWPKVASESTYEAQKIPKFSGGAAPRPP